MSNCQVSVIVPIYNAGNKLNKCITSILKQTFKEFELILVNDGSTDNSLDVCRKHEKQDSRIIVIDKNNEGCIVTRRKGLEASNAKYVMFVDADDWIDRNTIESLYNQSIDSDADITVCNFYKVLGNGWFIKKKNNSHYFHTDRTYTKEEIRTELVVAYLHGHPFPAALWAKLYRKELIINCGKYVDRIRFLGEDLFYNMEVFLKANKVRIIDKPLYYYRAGGFSSRYMPYLFEDMVNGYQIQKDVIHEYYQDNLQKHSNGISIMLLNTFRTCLYNIFNSNLTQQEKEDLIKQYVQNDSVSETLYNEGCTQYFSGEFLNAIKSKDIDYLYELGESLYKKKRLRNLIVHVL